MDLDNETVVIGGIGGGEDTRAWTYTHSDGVVDPNSGQVLNGSRSVFVDGGYGNSVSVDGDLIVVGAEGRSNPGSLASLPGSALIFRRAAGTWSEYAEVFGGDSISNAEFGAAVAVSDRRVFVGDWFDNSNGNFTGATYFFDLDRDRDEILNLFDADQEGDGIPGKVEQRVGLIEAFRDNSETDSDLDGYGDAIEYRRGTVINDGSSTPEGQVFRHEKLFKPDADVESGNENFGYAVATTGDWAFVAATRDNRAGLIQGGAIYVYRRIAGVWRYTQKLVGSDVADNSRFGWRIAADGDTLVAGSLSYEQVYVFELIEGRWQETYRFAGEDTQAFDGFGTNGLALVGDRLAVGAPEHQGKGAVYLFERQPSGEWVEQTKFQPVLLAAGDSFGRSIDIDATRVAVGAPGANDYGAAYVFERVNDEWVESLVQANDAQVGDNFGSDVALGSDYLAVSAEGDSDVFDDNGSVYVFEYLAGWQQVYELRASSPMENGFFGSSIVFGGDYLFVGSPFTGSVSTGELVRFDLSLAGQPTPDSFPAIDGREGQLYGYDVEVSASSVITGAWGDDDLAASSGAAYIFVLDRDGDGFPDDEDVFPDNPDDWLDTDSDGLGDNAEIILGTSPSLPDSDGDGLSDGDEVDRGTSPTSRDTDADGIDDDREIQIGSNPLRSDSDGDGIGDGDELDIGTDPALADTDRDGVNDYAELELGTNPTDRDSDDDGFLDGEEVAEGTDPLDADSQPESINTGLPAWLIKAAIDRGGD